MAKTTSKTESEVPVVDDGDEVVGEVDVQSQASQVLDPAAEPEAQPDRLENAPYGGRIEPGTDLSVLSDNKPNAQGNRYPPDVESLESENASIRRQASDLRTQADALDALADERQKEIDQLKEGGE